MKCSNLLRLSASLVFLFPTASGVASAQYAERSALLGSGQPGVDVSGRSVKNPRVRAVHSSDPALEGGTGNLIARDPFLAYQLGRNMNLREFRHRDGALLKNVGGFGGPMVDGTTAKITANNHLSCAACHNTPNGNAGGGVNFSKDSGLGRNTPHYYGGGIMEMLAIQIRQDLVNSADLDGDGWISAMEAQMAPMSATADSSPGKTVDFGSMRLDGGATGVPMLNHIIRVWYGVDNGSGQVSIVPGASGIDGVNTTHYNFELVFWGWGQRTPASALNPTNRAFFWDPMLTHSNLEAFDPSTSNDPDGDGVSEPTLSGAIQFPATHNAPDRGDSLNSLGFSEDDPDGDGHLNEISEGDLDLAEWFMLNAPKPAFAGTVDEYRTGRRLLEVANCTSCHVADWKIKAQSDTYAGDRRLFDFEASWNPATERLEGELTPLYTVSGEDYIPNRGDAAIFGLFTDLRHHDMGDALAETGWDGNENRLWRTAPLWGVGSGFPWGHDDSSLTLEDIIQRHGGEAAGSVAIYNQLTPELRGQLTGFLEKLVLYDVESLPADVDGDGQISNSFMVAGEDTGMERFNAEWLFKTPVQIQGEVNNADGVLIRSNAAVNLVESYGLNLPLRRDTDLDGWPDVWDVAPTTPGYKNGISN